MAKFLPFLRKQPSFGSVQQWVSKQLAYRAEQTRVASAGCDAALTALCRGWRTSQCHPVSPSGGHRSKHSAYPNGLPAAPLLRKQRWSATAPWQQPVSRQFMRSPNVHAGGGGEGGGVGCGGIGGAAGG
jgi:hypothetical protein